MVTTSPVVNVPVAPVVGQQGSRTPGGHYVAYKAQPALDPAATLALQGGNPWRPNTPGHAFYTAVLAKSPATVQAALDLAASALGIKPGAAQAHLRWLYTWGPYMSVNGAFHGSAAPVASAPVSEAPATAPAPKGKGRGRKGKSN